MNKVLKIKGKLYTNIHSVCFPANRMIGQEIFYLTNWYTSTVEWNSTDTKWVLLKQGYFEQR